jgi:mRNA interferase MazF
MNEHLRTVIVAPMTSKGFDAPFRPQLTFQAIKGRILLDQLRTVDKARFVKKLGAVSGTRQQKILMTLQEVFAT